MIPENERWDELCKVIFWLAAVKISRYQHLPGSNHLINGDWHCRSARKGARHAGRGCWVPSGKLRLPLVCTFMNTLEAIRIALQSLWANKLRSVLTLLGVVIAVATVIAVETFVNGINGYVAEKIFNLGADVFIVSKAPNVITNADQFLDSQNAKTCIYEDFLAVQEACTACKNVGATASAEQCEGEVQRAEQ